MKIGNIEFGQKPVFLAPMEDVTDIGFRLLCKRYGASMVYTEFVSAEALVRSVKSTVNKLTISEEERPVGIQIYGRSVEDMVEAAKIVEEAKSRGIELSLFPELTDEQQTIANTLEKFGDLQLNILMIKTGFTIGKLNQLLFEMEMNGIVRPMAGGNYHLIK